MLLGLIIVCGLLSLVYGVYTINSLMAADVGTARMQEISGAVAEGAHQPTGRDARVVQTHANELTHRTRQRVRIELKEQEKIP